jgi:hypothetical protein
VPPLHHSMRACIVTGNRRLQSRPERLGDGQGSDRAQHVTCRKRCERSGAPVVTSTSTIVHTSSPAAACPLIGPRPRRAHCCRPPLRPRAPPGRCHRPGPARARLPRAPHEPAGLRLGGRGMTGRSRSWMGVGAEVGWGGLVVWIFAESHARGRMIGPQQALQLPAKAQLW